MIGLLKNRMVGIDLRLGPAKKFYAVWANLDQLSRKSSIGFEEGSEFRVKCGQRDSLIIYAAA